MRDGRKVRNNLVVGLLGQVVAVLLGIILPKQILNHYGSEINGLLSSVTNIYAYIAIVEAGIAAASCQALYKPVSENDHDRANAVLAASHRQYQKTGSIYVALICLFSILYPLFIETELSFGAVALIVLFNGIGNAVNFFFHGKYLILLKADGKQYIHSGLDTVLLMGKQVAKIVLISSGVDVVVVQTIALLASVLQMVWITYYIKKNYPWVDLKVKPDFSAISQSKYVLAHEVNYLILLNLDTLLLTAFCSLKTVSVYALYAMLYGMITRVLHTVRGAFEFKIAQEYHRSKSAFLRLFETYEVCYTALATTLISIAGCFVLPFMRLYTAGITDINYIDALLPPLFALLMMMDAGKYPSDMMVYISGHFRQTKNSAIAETVINVLVSVALVQRWGICGVLVGTIAAAGFRMVYLIGYINKNVIRRRVGTAYLCWGINMLLLLAAGYINSLIKLSPESYADIFMCCIPYSIITTGVFFGVNFLCFPHAFKTIVSAGRNILHRKIKA